MSVLIAFVRFKTSERSYPVNCHRTDLAPGDVVYVEMPQQRVFKLATIERVEFQGWPCVNTIVGRRDEATRAERGGLRIYPGPNARFATTADDLRRQLSARGWKGAPTVSTTFRLALWSLGEGRTAFVMIRARGLNLLLRDVAEPPVFVGRKASIPVREGRFVSHWYNGARENLHDLALEFAKTFETGAGRDGAAFDRFFVPQGGRPRRPPRSPREDGLEDIYAAISGGSGAPAYLGDGLWVHPDGSWSED
ncbi:hypothetical protein F0U61_37665 [Archangium violaceum]|uniref:hypothetical protein n=1 Tax=Archangium violaceum TaxID=83451 RepID=UPI002B312699|nr:hypothetical protein F0U61_37665 [Archangium violaceum]